MSDINYKKVIEVFFEGTIDLLSWDEFWEFMDKREVVGETDIGEKIKDFPFPNILGYNPSSGFLCRLSDPVKIPLATYRGSSVVTLIKRPVQKLVDEYGPYVYGNTVGVEFLEGRKARITMTFAGCEVEGIIQPVSKLDSYFNKEITFSAERVDKEHALITKDGIIFQGTPVGVILYDRHKKKSYLDSLQGIYSYYS